MVIAMMSGNTELLYWYENESWYEYDEKTDSYSLTDKATDRAKASFEMWKEFNNLK